MTNAQAKTALRLARDSINRTKGPSAKLLEHMREVERIMGDVRVGGYELASMGSAALLAAEIVRIQEEQAARQLQLLQYLRDMVGDSVGDST